MRVNRRWILGLAAGGLAAWACGVAPVVPAGGGGKGDGGVADAGPAPWAGLDGNGGTLRDLRFAIVGDTRPASADDTEGYPTAVITQIWQDVATEAPAFAIATGDYMFANPGTGSVGAQLDRYLGARAAFGGPLYPAMGNHECNGYTKSNCGPDGDDGMTENFQGFMTRMLGPIHQSQPYYVARFQAEDRSWTAKVVVIAANAWSAAQASWLETQLAQPTTYTFVVRHEGRGVNKAPGVQPSDDAMARYPYTLLLAGHTHTFRYSAGDREVITGNGGAPLSGHVGYGYTLAERQADGTIRFSAHDAQTRAAYQVFSVGADGTPVP